MTRKEIDLEIEIDTYEGNYEDVIAVSNVYYLLDRVYDDIEEQTCSSCKHMEYGNGVMDNLAFCNVYDALVDSWQDATAMNSFGCNRWEEVK